MIYATFLTGQEYESKYTAQVQREVRGKDVHILTDKPELFPECKTEIYDKKVFRYYDKLTFLVRTVLERKQRVTFIDCDWFTGLHLGMDFDKDTFYTYALFKFENFKYKKFSMEGINLVLSILERNGYKPKRDVYIGEAIMSLPYTDYTEKILIDLQNLQADWESTFHQKLITKSPSLKRYSSYGVGYGEGGALTAVLQKYNIKLEEIDRKLLIHNNLL